MICLSNLLIHPKGDHMTCLSNLLLDPLSRYHPHQPIGFCLYKLMAYLYGHPEGAGVSHACGTS